MALYGASPLYIFGILDLNECVILYLSVLFSILLYWAINGYIIIVLKKRYGWIFILLSYFITLFSNVHKLPFLKFIPLDSTFSQYIAYPIITNFALNTTILLIIYLMIKTEEKQLAESTISELRLSKLEVENQVLIQQLQPHFLFNALSALKSLIGENKQLAEEYSVKLSNFLRYSFESKNEELVSVKE